MNHEFRYNWGRLRLLACASPFIVYYLLWRHDRISLTEGLVIAAILLWLAFKPMLVMAKVLVTESELHVSFLLPFHRGGSFRHDEIQSYNELAVRTKNKRFPPVAGIICPRGHKHIMVWPAGTKDFSRLNSLLLQMFPPPQIETENQHESQPRDNIDIYLRDCPMDRLLAWIESVTGPLTPTNQTHGIVTYTTPLGPVIVMPGLGDGAFIGVCFNTPDTPWATDVDCARQASRELQCLVRCDPGPNFPDVDPLSDVFLEIADGAEKLIEWTD